MSDNEAWKRGGPKLRPPSYDAPKQEISDYIAKRKKEITESGESLKLPKGHFRSEPWGSDIYEEEK